MLVERHALALEELRLSLARGHCEQLREQRQRLVESHARWPASQRRPFDFQNSLREVWVRLVCLGSLLGDFSSVFYNMAT